MEVKELFSDILKGSSFFILDSTPVYIKHFSLKDASEIDIFYSVFEQNAIKKGLLKELDQENYCIKNKTWTEENKNKLANLKERLSTVKISIQEIRNISQKILLENEEKTVSEEIKRLEIERHLALGLTVEQFVAQKIDNYYILSALYEDSELKKRKYQTEEFEDLTVDEIDELIKNYNNRIKNFTSLNLKKLALLPSFSNLFHLSNDNPQLFYGKSIVDLSFYQAELFQYGKYYKNMLNSVGSQPPEDIRFDPVKLEEWFEFTVNVNTTQEKLQKNNKKADGFGIVGKGADLKKAGIEGGVDLVAAAQKAGGTLDFKDFIRLHKK